MTLLLICDGSFMHRRCLWEVFKSLGKAEALGPCLRRGDLRLDCRCSGDHTQLIQDRARRFATIQYGADNQICAANVVATGKDLRVCGLQR